MGDKDVKTNKALDRAAGDGVQGASSAVDVAKPTPGPWRVWADEGNYTSICATDGIEWDAEHRQCVADVKRTDNELANARLISSAPELYGALKAIMESATDGRKCPEWLSEQLINARAALSKAEGKLNA